MSRQLLDRYTTYQIRDDGENFWWFRYGESNGVTAWYGFLQKPGATIIQPRGTFKEQEIYDMLVRYGQPFTQDDEIDLHVWLDHGGLQKLISEGRDRLERIKAMEQEADRKEQLKKRLLGEI